MISVHPPLTFLALLITNLLVPLSNSAPNPTMAPKRNSSSLLSVSDSSDPFRFPQQQQPNKKLRRMPHVFSKVLELPLSSDADVSVEDRPDSFRFAAEFDCPGDGEAVRVLVIESLPGIKKVLVGDGDELKVDLWRVRLPDTTCLEAATAVCRGGQLVVTVPKIGGDGGGGTEKTPPVCHGDINGSIGNSLAVC